MGITRLTSRAFNQDAGGAKKAARGGPVVITDRGRPSHVLLTYADYQLLLGREPSLVERLAMPDGGKVGFEPPRLGDGWLRPADLSEK